MYTSADSRTIGVQHTWVFGAHHTPQPLPDEFCGRDTYLRHVLERIADHPITRIQELLPWNLTTLLTASQAAA